jgi:iron uptake system component EfeO
MRAVAVGVSVSAAVAFTASGAGAAEKSHTVKVTLTDAGCPAKLKVVAGPTTFKVTNDGADNVSEFEVLDGNHILGEVENLAPGLDGDFSLTLKPGTYTTNCPGGDRSKGKLVVTGSAATALSPAAKSAVNTYRAYLVSQTDDLVSATQTFADAVVAGDVAAAKAAYGPARVPYERIEPVAETFGDLDPRVDARQGDVPAKKWSGFHKIEQALYVNNSTADMAPVAQQLVRDVKRLQSLVPDVQLEPATIANGAVELLNEVASSKITGEEERYSHIDLVDFAANVEGAQAAYQAVAPILTAKDPTLAATIDQRFNDVIVALTPYRQGQSFVLYTALNTTDTKTLAQAIDALAEPMSKVAKQVVGTKS